ncbi:MAG: hypothetical protein ACXU8N_19795 [Telluria sp.]
MKSLVTHRTLVASYLAALAGVPAAVPRPARSRPAQVKARLLSMKAQRRAAKK